MFKRNRRLRRNEAIRSMVRENHLSPDDLIYPVFVVEGENIKDEISSLPGNYHYSIDRLDEIVNEVREANIRGIILFGLPASKDEIGSSAFDDRGIVQRAIRKIKSLSSDLYVITDVCLCQYTDHGHCGLIKDGEILNDQTLEYISKTALSHVNAGADMVAPSDMMDGRIHSIRKTLDDNGYLNVPIMSYSAKYASAFYGPFRAAANSAPQFGDRRTYQMDPSNGREALKEMEDDLSEGADIIMIKPAMSYMDIICKARENFNIPIAAYSVSGEYAMIKSAAREGLIDEKSVALEMLLSLKRAGADLIITYFAIDATRWLMED